jgi:abhydrolase domain-containing protein 6
MIGEGHEPRKGNSVALGEGLEHISSALEAICCGLRQVRVDVGDSLLSTYVNKRKGTDTLLMLHGLTGSKRVWTRFARRFATDYHLIIPDLPGHGDTEFSARLDYQVSANCARMIQMLDALGIDRVHVVGSSMGGFIGAQLAIEHPGRVRSLALFAPAGITSPTASDLDAMVANSRNPFLVRSSADFDMFYDLIMSNPPFTPRVVKAHFSHEYKKRREQIGHMFSAYRASPTLNARLCEISVPTLVVWGGEDRVLHPSGVDVWKNGVREVFAEIWPGVGHMPVLEQPRRTSRRLESFLNTIKR